MTDDIHPTVGDLNQPISSPARAASPPKRSGNKKISGSLIAWSAATILAVYSAGYVGSQPAAAQVATQTSSATAVRQNTSALTSASTAGPVAATIGYKDGTFTGQGTSRHGNIQVQVVVQSGKIVSTTITGSTTRYPTSAIASLPGAVVSQQSPNVDLVSGATDSSSAFVQAVTNALAQAA